MNDSDKFNETSLPKEEDFYGDLNMEGITYVDYGHAKRVSNDFETRNLGDYHDLYVQSMASFFKNDRSRIRTIK